MAQRHDYAGSRHHVMARGGSRRNIYDGVTSRRGFLQLLGQLESRFGVRLHAYALMGNHYHLLVSSHRGKLSAAMQFLNGTHARRLNKRVGHDGPIYRRRFVSRLVEEERYWAYLLAYVHLNPLKDGFVHDARVLPWTSHTDYLGLDDTPWLHIDEHLELLGGVDGYRDFIAGVADCTIDSPNGFGEAIARFPTPIPARQPSPPTDHDVLTVVESVGLAPELIFGRTTRGMEQTRTWLTWWLDRHSLTPRTNLANILGVSKSTITRRIQKVEAGQAGVMPAWLSRELDETKRATAERTSKTG